MTGVSRRGVLAGAGGLLVLAGCGLGGGARSRTLSISAIPDQDPELLNRLYPSVARRMGTEIGLTVSYRPVTDYAAVVRAFEVGDLSLAWMGGLTGVQARSRVPGAQAIAQRDIDADFHSVFIARTDTGLRPFRQAAGLRQLAGRSFTFGSETSTSGRLMPQFFMRKGGFDVARLKGAPGFSGSHDATVELVATGSFEAGVLNEQVWKATVAGGKVDLSDVVVLWRTPGYVDYHWLARPDVDDKHGAGTVAKVKDFLFGLDAGNAADAEILRLFGAKSFIPTKNSNYDQIEQVARDLRLLT